MSWLFGRIFGTGKFLVVGGSDSGPPPPETFRITGKNRKIITGANGALLRGVPF